MSWVSQFAGIDPLIAAIRARNRTAIIAAIISLCHKYGFGDEADMVAGLLGGQQ